MSTTNNEIGTSPLPLREGIKGWVCSSVLLFGGTFDPIHTAHVQLAIAARQQLGMDEVWFLVTPQNPWKQGRQLSADQHRLEMVRRAVDGIDGLVASDYEFHLEKPTYTYQTLRRLREDYPERQFSLLVGGDNWMAFDHWAEYREILAHHPIAVYPRPGCPIETPAALADAELHLSIIDAPQMDVSSTEIRRRIACSESVDGMMADGVLQYIKEKKLYCE